MCGVRRKFTMNVSLPSSLMENHVSSITCLYFTAPIFETSATLVVNVMACVLISFFAICSSVGNILIVIGLWRKTTSLQTPANILLGWFAFCDFLLGFLAGPAFVVFKSAEMVRNFELYCVSRFAYEFCSQTALNASFIVLTFMSIDRYLSLHLHLRYREVVTKKRITTAVVIAWLLSVSMTATRFWVANQTFLFITKSTKFICLFIIVLVYLKILVLVQRHQQQIMELTVSPDHSFDRRGSLRSLFTEVARFKKYAYTVAFVAVLIVACYVPTTVVSFCKEYVCTEELEHAKILYTMMVTFVFLTTALHPLVFIARTSEVTDAIKRILRMK